MIEIAVIVILIAVVGGGIFFYLKQKKVLEQPSNSQNSSILADSHKPADETKPDVTPAAEKTVVTETVQTVTKEKTTVEEEPTPLITPESEPEVSEEEQMLRRHHLHNVRLMAMATTFPHPTDSVLSRHYDEMIDAKAEDCLSDEAKMARLVADYDAYEKAQILKDTAATVPVHTEVPANIPAPEPQECCQQPKRCAVPEDSALRRHYLSMLRTNIESSKAPRPADSALRRHYDAMIDAEIENHLACS